METQRTVRVPRRNDSGRMVMGLASAVLIGGVLFASAGYAQDSECSNEHWVGTWGNALHGPDLGVPAPGFSNSGFTNQTLRQIVHISVGGCRVRVRLSTFGAGGVKIGAARIARAAAPLEPSIVPGSDRELKFGGAPSINIPPGAVVVSDPVELDVPDRSDLAVSIYVPETTGPASWHFEGRQTSFISPAGNFTSSPVMPVSSTTLSRFWLAGVDVLASGQTGAIVALGDSITDGSQSTQLPPPLLLGANTRWTDFLAERLLAQPGHRAVGVLNEGMIGNRILNDGLGPNALARFDRDVIAQSAVSHVIVELGLGDTEAPTPADEVPVERIIQGHGQLIERAHEKGLKIFGSTLTPVRGFRFFSPEMEIKRQAVNDWIRESGKYDGVIDFDQVLRDPADPTRILPAFDSGDHAHPNDAGYRALADAIDLKLFRNTKGRQ